jgi:N-acetylglutamate synthase-like GNAT family acetyltransferase
MQIKKISSKNFSQIDSFFKNSIFLDRPLKEDVSEFVEEVVYTDNDYVYVSTDNNIILSCIIVKDILIQKIRTIKCIVINDNIKIENSGLDLILNKIADDSIDLNIFRIIVSTTDYNFVKNLFNTLEDRYDFYIDEVIESNNFSSYDIIHSFLNRQRIHNHAQYVLEYHLKDYLRYEIY